MATAAKIAAPEVVGHILLVPVADIAIGDRLRAVDEQWAQALGQMMLVDGQKTAIEICRLPGRTGWTLVAGAHRLTGARHVGMAYLKAIEVDNDAMERRLREIIENLHRKGLDPLDRAAFVGDMHELLRLKAGISPDQSAQSIAANARWQKAIKSDADDASAMIADAYGWTDEIAQYLGYSKRTVENDLVLRRRLMPLDLTRLRQANHPILRNGTQLLALAKLDERIRAEVIGLLCAGTVRSVSEAIALLGQKPKKSPSDKALSAFIGSFGRMSLPEKKAALVQLGGLLTPSLVEALAEVIDLPRQATPLAPERQAAINALRTASNLFGQLAEGALPVTDDMIEAAYDECEQALHGCEPAISNDNWEKQA
jgi:ParB-like chromosome segregation protein Spo0J